MTPELQVLTQRLENVERQVAHLEGLAVEHSDADQTEAATVYQEVERGFSVGDRIQFTAPYRNKRIANANNLPNSNHTILA